MTPDNAIWWLKLKAKQKQKEVAPIFQGHPLPVTDITAEPIGKGKYLAEFDKLYPRQPYQETNEYIRRFQPEKVVQKQAWRDVERNRLRDNYAQDGSLLPDWGKVRSVLNPKNWGVPDYTDKYETWGEAYAAARKEGLKEIMWNKGANPGRKNLNYAGTAEQQLKETGITDNQRLKPNIIRDRMENNIYDFEYSTKNPIVKMKNVILDNKKEEDFLDSEGKIPDWAKTHRDFLSLYLGKPQKYNTVSISKYKPSLSKEKNKEYFSVNSEEFQHYILKHLNDNYINERIYAGKIKIVVDENGELIPNRLVIQDIGTGLGYFTIDRGEDEYGEYISYWDRWDLNPYKGGYSYTNISKISDIEDLSFGIGKPFDIYDRIYYRENPDSHKYAEYDKKIRDLKDKAIKTQDKRYIEEANKLIPIRASYHKKQNKYVKRYYSDKELSELDINKKNFDTLALQRELSNRGYKLLKSTKEDGSFDGIWGDETKNALLEYQDKNKTKPMERQDISKIVEPKTGLVNAEQALGTIPHVFMAAYLKSKTNKDEKGKR